MLHDAVKMPVAKKPYQRKDRKPVDPNSSRLRFTLSKSGRGVTFPRKFHGKTDVTFDQLFEWRLEHGGGCVMAVPIAGLEEARDQNNVVRMQCCRYFGGRYAVREQWRLSIPMELVYMLRINLVECRVVWKREGRKAWGELWLTGLNVLPPDAPLPDRRITRKRLPK